MNLNYIEYNGRMYVTSDLNELNVKLQAENKKVEFPMQASFATYGSHTALGWFMSKLGYAEEVMDTFGETIYVNKKSYDHWLDRVASLKDAQELTFSHMKDMAIDQVREHIELKAEEKATIEGAISKIFEKKAELSSPVGQFKEHLKKQNDSSSQLLSGLINDASFRSLGSFLSGEIEDEPNLNNKAKAILIHFNPLEQNSVKEMLSDHGFSPLNTQKRPSEETMKDRERSLLLAIGYLIILNDKGYLNVVEECITQVKDVLKLTDKVERTNKLNNMVSENNIYKIFNKAYECIIQKNWPPVSQK